MNNRFLKLSLIGLLTLAFVSYSCTPNNAEDLLEQAQGCMETEPETALKLLDSIRSPQQHGEKFYMEYIVAHFLSKSKQGLDITADSLILQAKHYFDKNGDTNQKAVSSFCSGVFYAKKEQYDKALKCFLEAEQYARKADSTLLIGKSLQNIASVYYAQSMWEQAIEHYKMAHEYYKNSNPDIAGIENAKLNILTSIGNSYEALGQLDSAVVYFDKTLELANRTGNKNYLAYSYQNLGVALLGKHEYKKSKKYLHEAFAGMPTMKDSVIAGLNLAKVYNAMQQTDSAKYYTDYIQQRIPAIKNDYYTLGYVYEALAEYNKTIKNWEQASFYLELGKQARLKATDTEAAAKLLETHQKYIADIQKSEAVHARDTMIWTISVVVLLSTALIVFFYLRARNAKLQMRELSLRNTLMKRDIDLRNTETKLLHQEIDNYSFMEDVYEGIVNVWSRIQNKVYQLVQHRLPDEDRELYRDFNNLWKYLTEVCDNRFEKRAKDMLIEETDPKKGKLVVELLDREDLLLIMYLRLEYTDVEICTLLKCDVSNLSIRKERLPEKLSQAGYTREEINKILLCRII